MGVAEEYGYTPALTTPGKTNVPVKTRWPLRLCAGYGAAEVHACPTNGAGGEAAAVRPTNRSCPALTSRPAQLVSHAHPSHNVYTRHQTKGRKQTSPTPPPQMSLGRRMALTAPSGPFAGHHQRCRIIEHTTTRQHGCWSHHRPRSPPAVDPSGATKFQPTTAAPCVTTTAKRGILSARPQ